MVAYLIKHIPTGHYYQPMKHRGSNLSTKGKIYRTRGLAQSSLTNNGGAPTLRVEEDSRVHIATREIVQYDKSKWKSYQCVAKTKPEDWEIVEC